MYKKTYREEWKTKLPMCVCSHMLFCASLSGQEWEVVSISGSAHLQGRQWVDMSGRSEGSEDKGEVCGGGWSWVGTTGKW